MKEALEPPISVRVLYLVHPIRDINGRAGGHIDPVLVRVYGAEGGVRGVEATALDVVRVGQSGKGTGVGGCQVCVCVCVCV